MDIPGQRHEHGHGMFGRGYHISIRGVHYHNTPLARLSDIHIVQSYSGPAYHSEP